MRLPTLCATVFAILGLTLATAQAQEFGRVGSVDASQVPYRVFAQSGEPTIRVSVVGGGSAGIYEIGENTDFDEFLALASISSGSETAETRSVTTLRLYREGEGEGQGRRLVLQEQVSDLLSRDPNKYPELRHKDLVQIDTRTEDRFSWRDFVQVLSASTSIALLVERLGGF